MHPRTRFGEFREGVRKAFSSKSELHRAIQCKEAPTEGKAYHNEDLLPSPPSARTWNALHFFAFYLTTTFSPSSYNLGATLITLGLQWWHCIIAAVIGSAILTVIVILNSRGATQYHVGFPVYVRAAAGIGGAKVFIIVRASVATIYFATQSYYGGMLTSVCLRAIFGDSWDKGIPNTLPESAGITSKNLLAFFIFWTLHAVYTTIALLSVLGWAVHMNGGSLGDFSFESQVMLSGSALVWPMIQAINSVMSALCPILVNQPDVARYATKTSQATWSQGTGILISKVLVMFISCATTSACTGVLGESFWNVWDLYDAILTQFWGPGARAGMFFASLGMLLAIVATNAGTNSLPVGADISGLAPRYINIVRGQVLCATLAPLLVPWKIIASASSFLTFLGSYTVFLMPICGIMVVDYWIVRKGNFHIPSLYTRAPGTPYAYRKGWNIRAMVAWVAGVAFVVHGVAGSLDSSSVNQASQNMYKLGFLLSFFMGSVLYYAFSLIWPMQVYPERVKDGESIGFEHMTKSEGFFVGESVEMIVADVHGEEVSVSQGRESESGGGEKEMTRKRLAEEQTMMV